MKFLLFLCLVILEITSNVQADPFNGINYHFVNSSQPTNRSDNVNLKYCEYTYEDKDIPKLFLMIFEKKTEQRKIGFNCEAARFNCCGQGCCLIPAKPKTLLQKFLMIVDIMIITSIYLGSCYLVLFVFLKIVDFFKNWTENKEKLWKFANETCQWIRNRRQRDDVSVKTMDTEISKA